MTYQKFNIAAFWSTDDSIVPYQASEHKILVRKFLGWMTDDEVIILIAGEHEAHKFITQGLSVLARRSSDKIPKEILKIIESDFENLIIAGDGSFSHHEKHISSWNSMGFDVWTPEEFKKSVSETLELSDCGF